MLSTECYCLNTGNSFCTDLLGKKPSQRCCCNFFLYKSMRWKTTYRMLLEFVQLHRVKGHQQLLEHEQIQHQVKGHLQNAVETYTDSLERRGNPQNADRTLIEKAINICWNMLQIQHRWKKISRMLLELVEGGNPWNAVGQTLSLELVRS